MKARQDLRRMVVRPLFFAMLALVVSLLVACNSSKTADPKVSSKKTSAVAQNSTGPDIDLNCVINHLQNPPESFHYMFKDESSDNPWSEQADVTPQMVEGSFSNRFLPAPGKFQGPPQEIPHQYQWAIGRMASLFALVHSSSAVVNEGAEKGVNGYDTTKLSIDTARASAAEQGLYTSTLGPGGSEKGTVWVTSDGCPVKISIDEELHSKDGKVSGKIHYEEAMVRKSD
jgi:hypothetical protein